jgi:hypothetical protein
LQPSDERSRRQQFKGEHSVAFVVLVAADARAVTRTLATTTPRLADSRERARNGRRRSID